MHHFGSAHWACFIRCSARWKQIWWVSLLSFMPVPWCYQSTGGSVWSHEKHRCIIVYIYIESIYIYCTCMYTYTSSIPFIHNYRYNMYVRNISIMFLFSSYIFNLFGSSDFCLSHSLFLSHPFIVIFALRRHGLCMADVHEVFVWFEGVWPAPKRYHLWCCRCSLWTWQRMAYSLGNLKADGVGSMSSQHNQYWIRPGSMPEAWWCEIFES